MLPHGLLVKSSTLEIPFLFTTVDTVHHVAFLTYVISADNVLVYTVIIVVSVYKLDTLHDRMSSATVLILAVWCSL